MKKIILLMTALLSSTSVYAMCTPTGVNIEKCECAHPIIENGILTCGPTYCPTGTTCMPLGNCCQTEKVCGSSSTECCKDDEVCVNKTTCCPAEKPYLDTNGNCVECTSDTHCSDDKKCVLDGYYCDALPECAVEDAKYCASDSIGCCADNQYCDSTSGCQDYCGENQYALLRTDGVSVRCFDKIDWNGECTISYHPSYPTLAGTMDYVGAGEYCPSKSYSLEITTGSSTNLCTVNGLTTQKCSVICNDTGETVYYGYGPNEAATFAPVGSGKYISCD